MIAIFGVLSGRLLEAGTEWREPISQSGEAYTSHEHREDSRIEKESQGAVRLRTSKFLVQLQRMVEVEKIVVTKGLVVLFFLPANRCGDGRSAVGTRRAPTFFRICLCRRF